MAKASLLRLGVIITLASALVWFSVGRMRRAPERAAAAPAPIPTNHLIHEKSPYLLEHAHNPVDWYPWGEEAFARARREDKPIFLSVGYSTCHWCHVMARESFENPKVAAILNAHFVAVKVDREERPDVDAEYMAFVQATTGGGGWPMTVFLTPDLKPFFGGTYFPPEPAHGMPGLIDLLNKIAAAWRTDRAGIVASSSRVMDALRRQQEASGPRGALDDATFRTALGAFEASYDAKYGGFGSAPKFPRPCGLEFLLRCWRRYHDARALAMVTRTLERMARGGIHDALGGGFHRYATDRAWQVPHFEKMLYDQAQLATVYLEAWQITHRRLFAHVAADTLDYVLRDMRDPGGGFYCAEDADSPEPAHPQVRGEGAFYLWSADEIGGLLTAESRALALRYFGVDGPGRQILHVAVTEKTLARSLHRPVASIRYLLEAARYKLLAAREKRPRPRRDDKVLASWNGLMISALAKGWEALGDPRYRRAAEQDASFILSHLRDPVSGELKRRWCGGQAAVDGKLTDYAYFIQGLLDLYGADFDVRWLRAAVALQEVQDRRFADPKGVGYFDEAAGDRTILVRGKARYDGAEPTPNSVSAMNLARLAEIAGRPAWRAAARQLARAWVGSSPDSVPAMLVAADFLSSPPTEIVVAGHPHAPDTRAMLRAAQRRFRPQQILLLADGGAGQAWLGRRLPSVAAMRPRDGRATAYVCHGYHCELPTVSVARMLAMAHSRDPAREKKP